jgi:methionine synthase II (cobalamin-independent)
MCLAEDVDPKEVRFSELGYAREARASHLDFVAARERGELPAQARFQVCLPTPVAVVYSFCTTRDLLPILDAYETAMIREVKAVGAGIPHADLCVQFDICQEMILCDGQPQDEFPAVNASLDELMERVRRLTVHVPSDAELGFHLCYGDFGARHFIEPRDASRLVDVANTLARIVEHPIAYVHMPVPLSRTDDDYFRPLTGLDLPPDTELYLGLIHAQDGVEGTRRRIVTARKYAESFGIGTECGLARARKPDLVRTLLELHAELVPEPA